MKTMKLLPLKIAVTSAMIIGLGAASTANAQQQQQPRTETFLPNLFDNDYTETTDPLYHGMILGNTAITQDNQYKFYAENGNEVPDSLFFNKILHDQQLNGFKEGDTIIPLDENGKPVYKLDEITENGVKRKVYSVTTKTATAEDVATSPYANGIQKDIDDLYDFDHQVTERLTQHGKTIYRNGERILANEESVQYLNKEVQNNIEHIYELAQQQDQHSSDIKTLAKASAANTNRIATAELGIAENKKDAQIAKAQANANKTAIDANKASADTKFAATADAITKNGNAITKNAKSITDLGTKVDGFDGRVTALDTKVNAFDGRITALDSKVENGMAAQAALSGLFQPYSVGKFNATAALGGYGSKSAVAIGAGYRVNPNLAFKAGAAINTSGNKKGSYNIGVNYEF